MRRTLRTRRRIRASERNRLFQFSGIRRREAAVPGQKDVPMGSTQAEVEVSYDVSNEFFRLWLDERMNYTCGIFDEPSEGWHTDNLEEAQVRKLQWHAKSARLSPEKRLLDIGCGWGANLEFQALSTGVKECHGITLSRAQHDEIMQRKIPGVTASVCSYLDYKPAKKFDAIISICMMEHICSPEEARAGKHIEL